MSKKHPLKVKKTHNKFMFLFYNQDLRRGLKVVLTFGLLVEDILNPRQLITSSRSEQLNDYHLMDNLDLYPGIDRDVIQFVDTLLKVLTLDELVHMKWSRWADAMTTNDQLPEIVFSMGILTEKVRKQILDRHPQLKFRFEEYKHLFERRKNRVKTKSYLINPPTKECGTLDFDAELAKVVNFLKYKGIESVNLEKLRDVRDPKAVQNGILKEIEDRYTNVYLVDRETSVRIRYLAYVYCGHEMRRFHSRILDMDMTYSTYRGYQTLLREIEFAAYQLTVMVGQALYMLKMISLSTKPNGDEPLV